MSQTDNNRHRWCVIMCGGVGSRFWPYSRVDRPKQFIDFLGTGRSLVQMTYDRLTPMVDPSHIVVVTNARYADTIREQLPDVPAGNILLEPARRSTAPCIAWAAWHIAAADPEASIIVTPADHLVTREREFEKAVLDGFDFVGQNDVLLTMAVTPTRPETAYGYIQIGKPLGENFYKVKTFTQKPKKEMAEVFVSTGEFFWNSGIFLWKASAIIDALAAYAPEVNTPFADNRDVFGTAAEAGCIARIFPACPAISIDNVVEKATNACVETVAYGWNDLETWSSLYDISPKTRDGNVTQNCQVLSYNSSGNIFCISGDKLVAVDGLNDYIIADAGDVLLICPKIHEQDIRHIVNDAKVAYGDKFQ